MAHTVGTAGGSTRPAPAPIPGTVVVGPLGRGSYPMGNRQENYTQLDEMIAELERKYKATPKGALKAELGRQLVTLQQIRDRHSPNRNPKKEQETTLDDIARILLLIGGFSTEILRKSPIPTHRMVGGYGNTAIRYGSRWYSTRTSSGTARSYSGNKRYYR